MVHVPGLLAIDVFTCGKTPSTTDHIANSILEQVQQLFPESSAQVARMLRFEHFDVQRYLEEYYGLPAPDVPLSTDNAALLRFFDAAYTRIRDAQVCVRAMGDVGDSVHRMQLACFRCACFSPG